METTIEFDLNNALQLWLQQLGQSPQVKTENLKELELHVRDSMSQLEGKGLSSAESFLIATRRVGTPAQLEPEFAKVNKSPFNAIVHGLVLLFFSIACLFLWCLTTVPEMMARVISAKLGRPLPRFSELVMDCGPWLIAPPVLAAIYCVYVWMQKSHKRNSWIGFFAVSMGVLVLLALPILMAALLPLISFIDGLPANIFQH
jgi:hypothetical protein